MRSALLVMDVQSWIVERMALSSVLEPINEAIEAAREAAIPVIFVGIRFRPGSPDLSTRNMTFGSHRDPQREVDVEIDPRLDARQDDIVVVKKRASAFAGSDLEVVLRSLDVTALVLAASPPGASSCQRCARPPMLTMRSPFWRIAATTRMRRFIGF